MNSDSVWRVVQRAGFSKESEKFRLFNSSPLSGDWTSPLFPRKMDCITLTVKDSAVFNFNLEIAAFLCSKFKLMVG